MKKIKIILLHFCLLFSCKHISANARKTKKVLLISLDGFRWDLRNNISTPNLDWVVKHGISADYVKNVFPAYTLPNHQSIVTGLYPEHHGMVANDMYDSKTKGTFSLDAANDTKWWQESIPIWIDNEHQGHESGVCFWPGYNVIINGTKAKYTPSSKYSAPYASNARNLMPLRERLNLAFDWLSKNNVTFVALYIEQPDEIFHEEGLHTRKKKVHDVITKLDGLVGELRKKLRTKNLRSQVNVIITGDHGHSNLSYKKQVHLQKYVNLKKYATHITGTTTVMIYVRRGYRKFVYNKLKKAEDHFKVYLKEDIPDRYHTKNKRTADIVVVGEPGWGIFSDVGPKEDYRQANKQWQISDHGYSSFSKNMNPAFFGFGSMFRSGNKKKFIHIVEVYSLMCYVIGLKARKNDGNFDRIKDFLV